MTRSAKVFGPAPSGRWDVNDLQVEQHPVRSIERGPVMAPLFPGALSAAAGMRQ